MTLVVDALAAAHWLLDDENSPATEALLEKVQAEGAVAPHLWYYEIRNMMAMQERRGRLDQADFALGLALIQSLPIQLDSKCNDEALFQFTRQYRLTVYDASYLELARRKNLPLATFDKALAAAAKNEGITLLT